MAEKRAEAIVEDNGEDAMKLLKTHSNGGGGKHGSTNSRKNAKVKDDRRISGSGK